MINKKIKELEREKEDEEYLDRMFPKGETKFRGEAMVLLALARREGKKELSLEIEKKIDERIKLFEKLKYNQMHYAKGRIIVKELKELKQKLLGGKDDRT